MGMRVFPSSFRDVLLHIFSADDEEIVVAVLKTDTDFMKGFPVAEQSRGMIFHLFFSILKHSCTSCTSRRAQQFMYLIWHRHGIQITSVTQDILD